MRASHAYSGVALVLISGVLVTLASAKAQQAEEDTGLLRSPRGYRYLAQADAADELVRQLGSAAKDLDTLFQLSRLLSEPCDQFRWLAGQIDPFEFASDAEMRSSAEELLTRVTELEQALRAALRGCPEQIAALKQLLIRIAEPPTPWELTDPGQLEQRWRELGGLGNAELAHELTPERRLTLFARGIPPHELGLDGRAVWDQPRRVIDALAASEQLPEVWRLLRLQEALGTAERQSVAWVELAFPVNDTFQIARALLDRALGVDAQDRGTAANEPDWTSLAARLEKDDYWAWAALACVLEAAGQSDPTLAIADARTQWEKLARVSSPQGGALWPAVSGSEQSWLARLERGELFGAGVLPLAPGYRSAQRDARRRVEQQFLRARDDPAEALRLIQLAKAADIGLTGDSFQPITLAELEGQFQTTKRGETALKVFMLLEMLEISGGAGQPSQYYAFRLSAKEWRWTSGGFDAAVIGPADTPARLAQAALDASVTWPDLRILIAPDGPLDDEWFAYERDHLFARTARGWLCYLPTAGALKEAAWTLNETLRLWHHAAAGSSRETVDCYPGGEEPRIIPSTLYQAPNLALHAISRGPLPGEIGQLRPSRRFVTQFKDSKEAAAAAGRTLPVMLVFTGEQP